MRLHVKPNKFVLNENFGVVDDSMVISGLTDIIISSINDKWESVRNLNSLIVNLQEQNYEDLVPVVESVLENETNSIGQLQHLVEILSPDAEGIEQGKQEAEDVLDSVDSEDMF